MGLGFLISPSLQCTRIISFSSCISDTCEIWFAWTILEGLKHICFFEYTKLGWIFLIINVFLGSGEYYYCIFYKYIIFAWQMQFLIMVVWTVDCGKGVVWKKCNPYPMVDTDKSYSLSILSFQWNFHEAEVISLNLPFHLSLGIKTHL